ncbi:MAG: helix-turn-helix transcriptional regulator [Lachnospiraceae bacterium]|nr:helix-turn-helix transcriptional regulator [Lachnospiraceae bacterium]MBQ9491083.1 helix-turn-helix transcriptional regulator [Lachnospiraceae bacterium]MBR6151436.1 helix-turn-helix transcriptional regulator [Lachnospiraceae bacterium]
MSDLVKAIGQRIRNYRTQKGLSQEKLAELSGCHPTYIGQVERGEKNATLESLEKICLGLDLPLEKLFEKINNNSLIKNERNIPLECYELLSSKTKSEQEQIFRIILAMDKYKQN